jgi:hypothetical protein
MPLAQLPADPATEPSIANGPPAARGAGSAVEIDPGQSSSLLRATAQAVRSYQACSRGHGPAVRAPPSKLRGASPLSGCTAVKMRGTPLELPHHRVAQTRALQGRARARLRRYDHRPMVAGNLAICPSPPAREALPWALRVICTVLPFCTRQRVGAAPAADVVLYGCCRRYRCRWMLRVQRCCCIGGVEPPAAAEYSARR